MLWCAEAFATAYPADWGAFLGSLPGEPKRVVCDAHGGMLRAVEQRWPDAELHQCEWHLQHALERLLAKELRRTRCAQLEELQARAEGRSPGPTSGAASFGRRGRPRTTVSTAGSPSTARRSRRSSLAGHRRLGARPTCR
jgi:hypothetical protein